MIFHQKAFSQHRNNYIQKLQNDTREWKEGNQVDTLILDYFQSIFTSIGHEGSMEFLKPLRGRVTTSMNDKLSRIYCRGGSDCLKQIHPTKALSPNGMSPLFFKKYWHLMGNAVTAAVLQVLKTGCFPENLNHTFITLIPKKRE